MTDAVRQTADTKPADGPLSLPEIRVLPPLVVNQIAAGEVVERPASVVKELLDNAIDAGARRIGVELEAGGVELIRIVDDGCGMTPEQLPLAVHPHATSKIRDAADLDRIATMGFRGEALASIASVSRVTLRSRPADRTAAAVLAIEGDREHPVRPAPGPVGTSIEVRALFFNTPARRKFLKTAQTERGHCIDAVRAMAMSHPGVGFTLIAEGRTVFELPPDQPIRERVLAVIGSELEEQLLDVSADRFDDARGVVLWGLVGTPELARPTTRHQHVFLNGRPIRDRTIQHAWREAYRGLIEPGRQPSGVLVLEMDPRAVDVNVHPAKAEVRFRDQSHVHRVVYHAVKRALDEQLAGGAAATPGRGVRFEPVDAGPNDSAMHDAAAKLAAVLERLSPTAERSAPGDDARPALELREAVEATQRTLREEQERLRREREAIAEERRRAHAELEAKMLSGDHLRPTRHAEAPGQQAMASARPADLLLRVHNSFVVTQDEQGLVIIDQHALHERVMFEKLRERIGERGELESQRLLTPTVIEADREVVSRLDDAKAHLVRLGVDAEPLGPASIAVHAFPTLLFERGVDPAVFVAELLDRLAQDDFSPGERADEAALHEVLDMMACKAAVKAGDRLSDEELRELVSLRERIERGSNCPHGRPTAIRLTVRELERQFGRA